MRRVPVKGARSALRSTRLWRHAVARFSWKDLGEAEETEKALQFWMRAL